MRGGELDVVARRGNLVVVCEVKARAGDTVTLRTVSGTEELEVISVSYTV